ncbi:SusD-like starch-binding protein associating with outer membrane [Dysgonomonas alginatilytica]|uniref:SusD-like starch-binding protein associating with outer membrane n=1 Tax=Dysgonomonas alginatilytica TaxID=1605892 RepID=A0A2V3PJB9_9BACT|nr:SusD/RagB family nutrient-binding outer membrane lipoprotein [Dysgonomonas alginatilytica]PXV57128.1 SusD-like starch-binding protein associating with outer membrane [Dysgonomonas alginatilytica]
MLKKIAPLIILVLALSACNDQLDEININQNATEHPRAPFLLTGVQKQGADLYWGSENNYGSTLLFVQFWASIQYPEADRFDLANTDFTSLWNKGYATLITDLNTIINFPKEEANDNYKGIALSLRSWVFLLLTDAYGNIPYTEAGQKMTPAYDTQRDVYLGLLKDLATAQSLLNTSAEKVTGDVVYNDDKGYADIAKWKKFTNSLRLRIALRIADREPDLAKQEIINVVNDGAGLISSNSEIFQFIYRSSPQQNPIAAIFETRDDDRISQTIVNKLYELEDPRLSVFAQLPSDNSVGKYVGLPNAVDNPSSWGFTKTSKPGAYFLKSESPAVIFSYAEVQFGLSEAVARGFITGDAENYYKQAITASLNQFGVTDTAIVGRYLRQPSVKYNAANYKKSIGEQKWIAFYGQGLDAFAEWRRLDYPELKAGSASVLDGKIPVRFFYPGTEQSLNGKSYKAAVENQGEDLLTTRLWFDVK